MMVQRLATTLFTAAVMALGGLVYLPAAAPAAAAVCGVGGNAISCENSLPGAPAAEWDISGRGDDTIQGFSTDISVNVGAPVSFKIKTDAAAYAIDVYRLGWYGGSGARKVATVSPSVALPQVQPTCLSNPTINLVDCGNWAVSASWAIPATAISGVYIAKLTRADNGGASHIPFIVRDDASRSDMVFQTSDTTWQAYNNYGGADFYPGGGPNGRASKLSYNRPIVTRSSTPGGRDFLFGTEYPMIRFIERNGYDVSYISGIDADRSGALLRNHKTYLSVGHDEYWSGAQRANVEAARDAGVNLAFFSGNEVYWKTRYEPSIDGSATSYRTIVCYKETWDNAKTDPSAEWTGTWRDPRFTTAPNGASPENGLTGTLYQANFTDLAMQVPAADGKMRFWRNTPVATLGSGQTATLAPHTVGYESNEDLDNGFRPAGLFRLSTTTGPTPEYLQDYGNTTAPGTTTHNMTTYRARSGALVFSAGTIQWPWGLDQVHDVESGSTAQPADARMQQATINLLADMASQPTTLMPGMVAAAKSTDTAAPSVAITSPAAGTSLPSGSTVTVSGTATDAGGGRVAGVEVSLDGGVSWHPATGRDAWSYTGQVVGIGAARIQARAVDDSGNLQPVPASAGAGASCPCTVFGNVTPPAAAQQTETTPLELGLRITPTVDGVIAGVRFYKGSSNTGTHVGTLWSTSGAVLARGTFTGETASGWQEMRFATPAAVVAGTSYIVSYFAPNGRYHATTNVFGTARGAAPLVAPAGTAAAPNGVYALGNSFPTSTYQQTNYYVDAVFVDGATVPPAVSAVTPTAGSSGNTVTGNVSARFSKRMQADTTARLETGAVAGSGTVVPAAVTLTEDGGVSVVTVDPTGSLSPDADYTASVNGRDTAGNAMSAPFSWTFRTGPVEPAPGVCPCGIFPVSTPGGLSVGNDGGPLVLGMRFVPASSGTVRGVQFYKEAGNTGSHVGSLWSPSGVLLAQATFTAESASGWQEVRFATPVPVTAGGTYTVSYLSPQGTYSYTRDGFGPSGIARPPLSTPQSGGAFTYTSGAFPGNVSTTNYWVDVVFHVASDTTPPSIASRTPASGATAVDPALDIRAVLTEEVDTAAARTATVSNGSTAVPAAVTWTQRNSTGVSEVVVNPDAALAANTTYTVSVDAADLAGNRPAAPVTWSFTTAAAPGVPGACPCGVFADTDPGATALTMNDGIPLTVGMRFTPTVTGRVTGAQFLKQAGHTGTHTASLWSAGGSVLAQAAFSAESAAGWQTVSFPTAVSVTAGTEYVVSYTSPGGQYAYTRGGFGSGLSVPPLSTGADAGAFTYTSGAFPASRSTLNFWVDVVYGSSAADTTAPAVASRTPASGATGVDPAADVTAVFSEVVDTAAARTATVSTGSTVVPAVVTWTQRNASGVSEVRVNPDAALAASTTYTVRLDAADLAGNRPATAITWSFTTAAAPPSSGACPCGVFPDTDPGATALTANDGTPLTVGMRFTPTVTGRVTGAQFLKQAGHTGTHTASLWSAGGSRLAQAAFSAESAAGWQTVSFPTAVSVTAGTEYVVSYTSPGGQYAYTRGGFGSGLSVPPLRTGADAGAFTYTSGAFPASRSTLNYWVDVVYAP